MSDRVAPAASACPGCGAVLAELPGAAGSRPGGSPSCSALFDVTVRGLREEASSDPRAGALLELAEAAYAAQHVREPAPLAAALLTLRARLTADHGRADVAVPPPGAPRPDRWTSTPADVAADLDVVDLPALVRAWGDAVRRDWAAAHGEPADRVDARA